MNITVIDVKYTPNDEWEFEVHVRVTDPDIPYQHIQRFEIHAGCKYVENTATNYRSEVFTGWSTAVRRAGKPSAFTVSTLEGNALHEMTGYLTEIVNKSITPSHFRKAVETWYNKEQERYRKSTTTFNRMMAIWG